MFLCNCLQRGEGLSGEIQCCVLQISTVKKLSGICTTGCGMFVIKYKSEVYILDIFMPYWAHAENIA